MLHFYLFQGREKISMDNTHVLSLQRVYRDSYYFEFEGFPEDKYVFKGSEI